MQGFGRMQVERRRSRRTERCGNLARDQAALAHARSNHASGTAVEQLDCAREVLRHGPADTVSQPPQGISLDANNVLSGAIHGKKECNNHDWLEQCEPVPPSCAIQSNQRVAEIWFVD